MSEISQMTFSSSALSSTSGASSSLQTFAQDSFGAQVVSKTLDYMNSSSSGSSGMNQSYDFQKSVLSAVYTGTGTVLDDIG